MSSMWRNWNLHASQVGIQSDAAIVENSLAVLQKDPAIPFLNMYPGELETYVHTKASTWMCISSWRGVEFATPKYVSLA